MGFFIRPKGLLFGKFERQIYKTFCYKFIYLFIFRQAYHLLYLRFKIVRIRFHGRDSQGVIGDEGRKRMFVFRKREYFIKGEKKNKELCPWKILNFMNECP